MNKAAAPSERYELLDYLRGIFLAIIMFDHMNLFPSVFDPISLRGNAWVTAAEGFFFLSGLLVVVARMKRADKTSLKSARNKLLRRALKLAVLYILSVIFFTIIARLATERWDMEVKDGLDGSMSTLEMIWKAATFRYTYGWLDFLKYYAAYLIAAIPLSYLLIRRKLAWTVLLLGVLPMAWVSWQGHLEYEYQWLVWWAYFAAGMTAGAYFDKIKSLAAWSKDKRLLVAVLGLITVTTAFVSYGLYMRFNDAGWLQSFWDFVDRNLRTWTDRWLGYNRTGILRLPIFLIWLSFGALLMNKLLPKLPKGLKKLLKTFGSQSLRCYIVEGFVVFFAPLWLVPDNFWANSIASSAAIILVYWLLKRRIVQRTVPN